jgi:hypothetical protein
MLSLCLAPAAKPSAAAEGLEALRREVRVDSCMVPAKEELLAAEKLFALAFSSKEDAGALASPAAVLGFEVLRPDAAGELVVVLREAAGRRQGRGMYAFRRARASPLAIQAPHSDDDLHTGALAASLFAESSAAAAAWNTAPRRAVLEGRTELADFAHLEESYFQAFTRAFAAAHPKGICLQIHGFARDQRKTTTASAADAIVSDGDDRPEPWIEGFASCLERATTWNALVYPRQVRELGGTRNAQGMVLQRLEHAGFLHLELSLEARRELKENAASRRALLGCLPERQP